jgi:superfamily II DNA or RNA helicase
VPRRCRSVDKQHAQSLKDRFRFAGANAGYQDTDTPQGESAEIRRRFHDETITVVVNIQTLTTGVDWD